MSKQAVTGGSAPLLSCGHRWFASVVACSLWACSDPPVGAASADATKATTGAADGVGLLDLTGADTASAISCPGGSGCACTGDDECATKVCGDEEGSATGKACAAPFGGGCPAGQVAITQIAGEGVQVCVSARAKLCNPCTADANCVATGSTGALCINRGGDGSFCGMACSANSCPSGYACQDAAGASGNKAKQCVPVDSGGAVAACACSIAAKAAKIATSCSADNCKGQRFCGDTGLSVCDAKAAVAEICNGQDDNCNGATDEGDLCGGSVKCVLGSQCANGKCTSGTPKICDDANPCTAETCDTVSGNCTFTNQDGGSCTDGDPCTTADACAAGQCQGGPLKACSGGACSLGECSKSTGICQFAAKPDLSPCDDGNGCTLSDACTTGVCLGQPKVCADADPCTIDSCAAGGDCTATTASDGNFCDDGQPCTGDTTCKAGVCQPGKATAPCQCVQNSDCAAQDDGKLCNGVDYCDKSGAVWACKLNPASVVTCEGSTAPCLTNVCVEPKDANAKAACTALALANGVTCNDGLAWTIGDVCAAGKCVAGEDTKLCQVTADCTKYEDGDLCNGTLFCNKATGVCQVQPKSIVPCPSVDDTVCHKNSCDPKSGQCKVSATNELKACEDGNLCTTGEACKAGICTATVGGGTCLCTKDTDCGKFEDGDLCNGALFCNVATMACEVNPTRSLSEINRL